MANEYAPIAQLKTWMGISTVDVDRDALLTLALASASRLIDEYCGRRFFLDDTPTERSFVGPLHGDGLVLLVDDIGDADTIGIESGSASITAFDLLPLNAIARGHAIEAIGRVGGWSAGATVRVTARWGWPVVPDQIAQATLIEAARIFKRKDSPEGVVGSADWGAIRMGRSDPEVVALLAPFRFVKVA